MPSIRELQWRRDRIEHIARHAVSPEEVEAALFEDPAGLLVRGGRSQIEEATLYRYYGRTEAGRHLLIVLIYVGHGMALPVTAREMTPAERRMFDAHTRAPR